MSLIYYLNAYFDEQLALVEEQLKRFSPEEIEEVQRQLDELDYIAD